MKIFKLFALSLALSPLIMGGEVKASSSDSALSYETFAASYAVYRWSHDRGYSYTELVTNANGFNVPVTFYKTGAQRVINGQVRHQYVGIVENTDFGVTNVVISEVE